MDITLTPEQLAELEHLALQRGTTVEQLFSDALDQFVLRQEGRLN